MPAAARRDAVEEPLGAALGLQEVWQAVVWAQALQAALEARRVWALVWVEAAAWPQEVWEDSVERVAESVFLGEGLRLS